MKKLWILIFCFSLFLGFQIDQTEYWTPPERMTWNSGKSQDPLLRAEGSNVHVFWYDNTPGNNEIYYKRSTNSTYSWSAPKRLTFTSGGSQNHSVCHDSSNIYIVWEDNTSGNFEIYFKSSSDAGVNWSPPKRLTYNTQDSKRPVIINDSTGNLHLVWHQPDLPGGEIFYRKSTDQGGNWTPPKRLTWNSGNSWLPDIAVSQSGILQVVWTDFSSGNYEIYHKRSIDGGSTWTNTIRLTWTSGETISPAVTVDGDGMVLVFWSDDTSGNNEIFLKRSSDGGSSWTAPKRMTWTAGESVIQKNGAYSGGPSTYLTWMDSISGVFEIFYSRTTDSGVTWQPKTRMTWNSRMSMEPSIYSFYIIWYEYFSTNNTEIVNKHQT